MVCLNPLFFLEDFLKYREEIRVLLICRPLMSLLKFFESIDPTGLETDGDDSLLLLPKTVRNRFNIHFCRVKILYFTYTFFYLRTIRPFTSRLQRSRMSPPLLYLPLYCQRFSVVFCK